MGFYHNTKNVLLRELKRISIYPVHITFMVILPTIALSLLAILFSDSAIRDLPIAVLDQDKTPMSRSVISMVDATAAVDVAYHIQDMEQGEKMMAQGKIHAIVYIPSHLERDILSTTPTTIMAYVSGGNIAMSGLMSQDIQAAVRTYSTGIQLQMMMKQGLSRKEAMAQVMPVKFDKHILFNPYINYAYYLLPSFMPMMLMVFTLMITIFTIGSELKTRSAGEWFKAARGSTMAALIGKLLPYTLTMWIMCLLMNTIMYKWVGVPMNGSIVILTISSFMFILAYQSIAVLAITLLANLRLALSLGGGYSVLAFTFSGLTFPKMAMAPILQVASYVFPFTIFTEIFIDQAMRGTPAIYTLPNLGWLALYILLPLLCLPRLKVVATNEKYWGRL